MNSAYRTKMEYAIYVDDQELLHIAQHIQGTRHGVVPTDQGSPLALTGLNNAAIHIMKVLNSKDLRKSQLKGIMVRYSRYENKSVCYLYLKDEELKLDAMEFFDETLMKGMFIYYSTKKSPAYVQTSLVSSIGERDLVERLGNKEFIFPSDGFFQINIPIVEEFIKDAYKFISKIPKNNRNLLVDLYAGVGTIGIFMGDLFEKVIGVELFPGSKEYALKNAIKNGVANYEFHEGRSEDSNFSEFLTEDSQLFLDPPRAGCSPKVLDEILYKKPEYIFYLSCNPETQVRDIEVLASEYQVIHTQDYDFFPNTDHLERFVILKKGL